MTDPEQRRRVKRAFRFRENEMLEPEGGWAEICELIVAGALGSEVNTWAPRARERFHWAPFSDQPHYQPALFWAAAHGPLELVEALLRAGADPNLRSVPGAPPNAVDVGPPLFQAVLSGRPAVVKTLLDAGADPNFQDQDEVGLFPLCAATSSPELVRLLLEYGADPLAKTAIGETALMNALAMGRHDSARILREACWARIKDQPGSTVQIKRGKKKYDVATARGVSDYMARFYRDDLKWLVIVAQAPVDAVAGCIAKESGAARWEKDARDRHVLDGRWAVFVLKLRGRRETLALIVSGAPSIPSGMAANAQRWAAALSRTAGVSVLVFDTGNTTIYEGGDAARGKAWNLENDERYFDVPGPEREEAQEEAFANMEESFSAEDIFIPPAEDASDGLVAKLELRGIKKDDVERIDVVVLEEHPS